MKIIILGAGQVGRTAAYHLAREEANDVTVVDTNDHLLRDLQDRLDIRTVAGNGAHPNVLEMAGAANADMIVALTNSDEVNMVACQVAWTLFRTRTKIARIRSLAYTGHEGLFFDTDTPPPAITTRFTESSTRRSSTITLRMSSVAARKNTSSPCSMIVSPSVGMLPPSR